MLAQRSWLESKVSEGGTSSARVAEQLAAARELLSPDAPGPQRLGRRRRARADRLHDPPRRDGRRDRRDRGLPRVRAGLPRVRRAHRAHRSRCSARPGTAYVYFSYGVHALLNVVCEREGVGAAVLLRALEPTDGHRAHEQAARAGPAVGPVLRAGKLTQALGVGLELNRTDLVRRSDPARPRLRGRGRRSWSGPRIGITKAPDLPWRFCAAGSRHVSRPWPPGAREALPGRLGRRRCRRPAAGGAAARVGRRRLLLPLRSL